MESAQTNDMERRLATIMMADVAGYSRMMGSDEERTVRMLRGHREVFDALLKMHRGRIFNTAGDAILAEFPSAVEAVRCATEIQSALRTRNERFPAEERMWFRIGINLGDVIIQGTDLLGDGVNVAARIQTVAEPGGICISGSVYDQIQNKLTLQFKMLGEKSYKNIAQPIRTFSVATTENGISTRPTPASSPRRGRTALISAFAIIALLIFLIAAFLWYREAAQPLPSQLSPTAQPSPEPELTPGPQVSQPTDILRPDLPDAEAAARERRLESEARAAKAALEQAELAREQLARELKQAEEEKRAAESARHQAREAQLAAESAQQQARLESEAREAKAALERAELERQRLVQALQRAEEERQATVVQQVTSAPDPARVQEAPTADPVARFNGIYIGNLCNEQTAESKRFCWPVVIKVKEGEISGNWETRTGALSKLNGKIAQDGTAAIKLASQRPDGKPVEADLLGKVEEQTLKAAGKWKIGLPVSGEWHRSQ